MIQFDVVVSTDTAAKLLHEAKRLGKSVEDVAAFYLEEGASTCAFLFDKGASTHTLTESEEVPYEG